MDFLTAMLTAPEMIALGWMLIHSIWQVTIIAFLLWLLFRCWPNYQPLQLYWIFVLGLFAVLLTSGVTYAWYYSDARSTGNDLVREKNLLITIKTERPHVSPRNVDSDTFNAKFLVSFLQLNRWVVYVPLFWVLGIFILGIRFSCSLFRIQRLRKTRIHPVTKTVHELLDTCKARLQIPYDVKLLASELVHDPITLGHFKPLILLPVGMINALTVDEVEMILLHELMHIKRRDYLINVLQSLMEVFFFFHPLVWWMSRNIRTLREHCCDDAVIQSGQNPTAYAETLIHLQKIHLITLNPLVMHMSRSFTDRIKRLFGEPLSRSSIKSKFLGLGIVLALFSTAYFCSMHLYAQQQSTQNRLKNLQKYETNIGQQKLDNFTRLKHAGNQSLNSTHHEYSFQQKFEHGLGDLKMKTSKKSMGHSMKHQSEMDGMEMSTNEKWSLEVTGKVTVIGGSFTDVNIDEKPIYYLNDKLLIIPKGETFPMELRNMTFDSAKYYVADEALHRFGTKARDGAWFYYKDYARNTGKDSKGYTTIYDRVTSKPIGTFRPEEARTLHDLYLFPNPSSDRINFRFQLKSSSAVDVQILDSQGKLMKSRAWNLRSGEHTLEENISALPAGNYYMSLNIEGYETTKPFLKTN